MIVRKDVTKKLTLQKTLESFNYILGGLQKTKKYVKLTPVAAVKLVKHNIALNKTISVRYRSGGK